MSEPGPPRSGGESEDEKQGSDPAQQMLDAIEKIINTLDASPIDDHVAIEEARKRLEEFPLVAAPSAGQASLPWDADSSARLESLILRLMTIMEKRFDVLQTQNASLQEDNKFERDQREAADRRATKLFVWGVLLGLPVGIIGSFVAWFVGIS